MRRKGNGSGKRRKTTLLLTEGHGGLASFLADKRARGTARRRVRVLSTRGGAVNGAATDADGGSGSSSFLHR